MNTPFSAFAIDRLLASLHYLLGFLPKREPKGVAKLPDCGWIPVEGKDLMRRRIDEEWQYRAMTEAEFKKYKSERYAAHGSRVA